MHPEMTQVIKRISTSDLPKIDDPTIPATFLVNMRGIEISMRKPGLLTIQQAIEAINDLSNRLYFPIPQHMLAQQRKIVLKMLKHKRSI